MRLIKLDLFSLLLRQLPLLLLLHSLSFNFAYRHERFAAATLRRGGRGVGLRVGYDICVFGVHGNDGGRDLWEDDLIIMYGSGVEQRRSQQRRDPPVYMTAGARVLESMVYVVGCRTYKGWWQGWER
ncbi:hypothetical protein GYMLUDRAFT_39371 [Collybiopsis luxurians FD-317 M1]|nr:hypothetical protein GYMLUDRAFT_39371 [Collybiopsis luxurians FD-317 M1]